MRSVGRMVWWETAVVAVGLAAGRSSVALALTTLLALGVVATTVMRVHGLWLYQWPAVAVSFTLRRRRAKLPYTADAPLALAELLVGRCTTTTRIVRGQPVAMLCQPEAVAAVVRLPDGAMNPLVDGPASLLEGRDEPSTPMTLRLLLNSGAKPEQATHTWVVLAAQRTAQLADDQELGVVLINALRRVLRVLDQFRAPGRCLGEPELMTTVAALAHVDVGRRRVRERWGGWSAGVIDQLCLQVRDGRRLTPRVASELVSTLLYAGTGRAVTIAIAASVTPQLQIIMHDPIVRVAADRVVVDDTVSVMSQVCRSHNLDLLRLDGRHARGVAASLPLFTPASGSPW